MMKIARIRKSDIETYGLVRDGKIATKDDITDATAVPIPINVRDFLFDGWIKEFKGHFGKIPFEHDINTTNKLIWNFLDSENVSIKNKDYICTIFKNISK